MMYISPLRPDELYHHGVKGQKWGLRRFQNPDGSLTSKGRERYNLDSTNSKIGRSLFNTARGQKLAVSFNKGFKEDKKQINEQYKKNVETIGKEKAKIIKTRNVQEARTAAADAIYSKQSHETNKIIQTQSMGKAIAKSMVMGDYGSLVYTRLKNPKDGKSMNTGKAVALSIMANTANTFSKGTASAGEYLYTYSQKKR